MNPTILASQIIEKSGGLDNISSITHCVTRLRLVLADESKADAKAINDMDGVISTLFSSGQFQVVIGPAVGDVYKEVISLTGNLSGNKEAASAKKDHSIKGLMKEGLDTLIACFIPCLAVISGCGMIKVLAVLLSSTGLVAADSSTLAVLNVIGDSVFYFLPIFAAYNAAKKIGTDPFLAMVLGCILLHPSFTALGEPGTSVEFFGLPLMIASYSAQALPAIFGTWGLKYAEKFADKISPNIVKIFLRPMIALLITAPLMLLIIGPITDWLSGMFMQLCMIMQTWGWIAVGMNAMLFPVMVLTGTHNASIPLIVQLFAAQGYDNIFLVSGMAANLGIAGAALGIFLKSKKKNEKAAAGSAAASACLGITEPALYGVLLPNKSAFVSMMLGALVSGCLLGMANLSAPTFMTPSFITAALFFQNVQNTFFGIAAVASTLLIPAVLSWFLYKPDAEKEAAQSSNMVCSPVTGQVIRLEDVKDPVFSQKAMGEGFGVIPSEGVVKSPANGTVTMLYPTHHAVGITTDLGAEILIHIGMDTVQLNGEHFSPKVKQGQRVKAGDKLIEFNLNAIKKAGYDPTTAIVVTNTNSYPDMELKNLGNRKAMEEVLCLQ